MGKADTRGSAAELEGRGLDAAVAREVMELPDVRYEDLDWVYTNPETGSRRSMPTYSSDIAAAWEVVEKMRDLVNELAPAVPVLEINPKMMDGLLTDRWIVSLWNDRGFKRDLIVSETASTAPEAICRAALKAVRCP